MKFKDHILLHYMSEAPFALAFERYLECCIFERLSFEHPILDMGCGDGVFAHILFSEPLDTGVDINPRELKRAQELGAYRELIHARGDSVPRPDGFYKTIISNSVLEHIQDLAPVLKEIHRLLAPEGRFYLTVPVPEFEQYTDMNRLLTWLRLPGLASRYRKFCSKMIWRQYHYFTLEEWSQLLSRSGFRVLESFTYDPKTICLMNDFLYPWGVIAVLNKKLFNRWVLFPFLRRIMIYPIYLIARKILRGGDRAINGGLAFLALARGNL